MTKFPFFKLNDGTRAKAVYPAKLTLPCDSKTFSFIDLKNGKTAQVLAFVNINGEIILSYNGI